MSMTYNVFLSDIDDSKIQDWLLELNRLGMSCQIHPEFSFKSHSGFLPFKINVKEKTHDLLLNKDYLTGFEFYLDDFKLGDHQKYVEQGFLQKILKKPKEKLHYHSPEIDEKLEDKKFVAYFVFGVSDTFELRMATLASAALSKICDGICCYADDDLWYENENVVENALDNVCDYEKMLKEREFRLHEFEGWV